MIITINQDEITKAIIQYVATMGVSVDNSNIDVRITNGRGANGSTATIAITPEDSNKTDEVVQEDLDFLED